MHTRPLRIPPSAPLLGTWWTRWPFTAAIYATTPFFRRGWVNDLRGNGPNAGDVCVHVIRVFGCPRGLCGCMGGVRAVRQPLWWGFKACAVGRALSSCRARRAFSILVACTGCVTRPRDILSTTDRRIHVHVLHSAVASSTDPMRWDIVLALFSISSPSSLTDPYAFWSSEFGPKTLNIAMCLVLLWCWSCCCLNVCRVWDINGIAMQHATGSPQQFCLRWNNYQSNLTNVFDQLLQSESFVDVTLACDGHSVKAHKMVLSACSPYFQSLFFENPCQHPIVIMRDIKWPELKAAVEFMYKGEINVSQEQIGPLLKVAESLKIRGLADVNGEQDVVAPGGSELTARPSSIKPISTPNNHSGHTPVNEWDSIRRGAGSGAGTVGGGAASETDADNAARAKKRRRPSGERSSMSSPAESASTEIPEPPPSVEMSPAPSATPLPTSSASVEPLPLTLPLPPQPSISHASSADDMEIKPGIAEMIREEERVSLSSFWMIKLDAIRLRKRWMHRS